MPSRIELGAAVGPVDVGLERLHGGRVRIDLHALVRLLDAPVDHVPERRELVRSAPGTWGTRAGGCPMPNGWHMAQAIPVLREL